MEREEKRLEQFRQLRKEIRGCGDYLVVGIDISKDLHNAVVRNGGRQDAPALDVSQHARGFRESVVAIERSQGATRTDRAVFGMEPTANYHNGWGEFLINRDYQVVLVSPEAANKNRSLLDGRWNKHDGKDCANVADLICQGKFLYYEYPCAELRNLLSLNSKLKRLEQGLRLRIGNHLVAQYFPEMDQYWHWGATEGLGLVQWCLLPAGGGFTE